MVKKNKIGSLKGLAGLLGIGLASFLPMENVEGQNVWDVNPYLQPRSEREFSQEWNKLWVSGTKEERINYVDSLFAEDKTNEISYIPDEWVCGDFAGRTVIDLHGFPELGKDPNKGLENNATGNIPLYYVSLGFHALNGILVGDNPKNFNDWYFIEPQTDEKVDIGDWNMPGNCEVVFKKTVVNGSNQLTSFPFLVFYIKEGVPSMKEASEYISKDKPTIDENAPKIKFNSPIRDSVYYEGDKFKFDFEVSDSEGNLDSVFYSLNGKDWNYVSNKKSSMNIDPEIGEHKYYVKASDWSPGNESNYSIDSINFKVDKKVGVDKNSLENKLKVYPVPATDKLNFENKSGKQAQLRIYNMGGQEIENIVDADGDIDVNVSNYNPGVYIFTYQNSDGVEKGKFVKK